LKNTETSIVIRTTGTTDKLVLLEKLLNSLSKQTVKDFELIIVCESNGNAVREIVSKFFPEFKVVETGYWNRCKTTNMGIKLANGKYVVLLDDDYVMDEGWLKEMLRAIKQAPEYVACIGSGCEPAFKEALKYKHTVAKVFETLSLSSLWKRRSLFSNGLIITIGHGGTHAICRKKALTDIGGYDEEINEPLIGDDLSLALKLWRKGYKNAINPKVKVYHLEKYVSKQIGKNVHYYENVVYSEIYTCAKYFDVIGFYVFPLIIYRILWGVAYVFRCRKLRILLHILRGAFMGLIHGLLRYYESF
jgi:GT2 family glycosyltransferase